MSGGGGSDSALNEGASLGVNFSPVNVNRPEPCRKVVRVAIPSGMPSSSGRVISRFLSCRLSHCFLNGLCACSICRCRLHPLWEELPLEFAHVCVAGVALEKLSGFWGYQ